MKRNLSQEMNKLQFRIRNRKCKKHSSFKRSYLFNYETWRWLNYVKYQIIVLIVIVTITSNSDQWSQRGCTQGHEFKKMKPGMGSQQLREMVGKMEEKNQQHIKIINVKEILQEKWDFEKKIKNRNTVNQTKNTLESISNRLYQTEDGR